MKRVLIALGSSTVVLLAAAPAMAAPNPSPVAPQHTGTACNAVLSHNPQAGPAGHSAPPAQQNFQNVGDAFCFLAG
jgi:hypothetical protein